MIRIEDDWGGGLRSTDAPRRPDVGDESFPL